MQVDREPLDTYAKGRKSRQEGGERQGHAADEAGRGFPTVHAGRGVRAAPRPTTGGGDIYTIAAYAGDSVPFLVHHAPSVSRSSSRSTDLELHWSFVSLNRVSTNFV